MTTCEDSKFESDDIHCPYCWSEVRGIEDKYGKYFIYESNISEKIIVLPVENPQDYFNLTWFGGINSILASIKGNQDIQKGETCPNCKRRFTLLVYPHNNNPREESTFRTFLDRFDSSDDVKCKTISDLFPFFFRWESYWITFFLSLWSILLINGGLLLFISFFAVYDFNANKQFIIDFFSLILIQAYFIILYKWHQDTVNFFYKTDELPFLFHEKYANSKDFPFFKNLISRGVDYAKDVRIPFKIFSLLIAVSTLFFIDIKFHLIQTLSGSISNNFSFSFILNLFLFLMLFLLMGFILGHFVFMSSIVMTNFTRSIPLKILPFEKSHGLSYYESFFSSTFIFTTIISFIIPICINIESLYKIMITFTSCSCTPSKYSTLLTLMLNGSFLYAVIIGIIVFSFLALLVIVTKRNISSRKSEFRIATATNVALFRQLKDPSVEDSILATIMLREYDKIENLSEYPFNKILFLLASGIIFIIPIVIGLIF